MIRFLCCLGLLSLAFASPAHATVAESVFQFTGDCGDCTGDGKATLVLQGYTLGTDITTSNFVSFTYSGTNLLPSFTENDADIIANGFVDGAIDGPLPAGEYFYVYGTNGLFSSFSGGYWCAGFDSCAEDNGINGIYSLAPTKVPEPASLALLAVGAVGLGTIRRRR